MPTANATSVVIGMPVSTEFALTVADAWHGKGVGRALLERLGEAARRAGYARATEPSLREPRNARASPHSGFEEESRAKRRKSSDSVLTEKRTDVQKHAKPLNCVMK